MPQVAEGTYVGTIKEAGTGKSKNGTLYVYVNFDVEGETRTVYLYCSQAAWKSGTREKLEAMGFNGDFNAPDFSVAEHELRCRHEEYNDQVREKWDLASWGGGYEHPEAAKDDLKKMNAMWKKDAQGSTRADAWSAFEAGCKEQKKEPTPELWAELLKSIRPGKEEDRFTASDWLQVKDAAGVPF